MSKPIDQRNRTPAPPPTRRPAPTSGAARTPASAGKVQPVNGTGRATGSPVTKVAPTRAPGTRNTITTTSRKPVARKSAGRGWKPLDLAIIVGFMLVVGVVIWFGLGSATNSNTTTNSAAGSTSGQTDPSGGLATPVAVGIGQAAPDFSFPATDGQTYSLSQFKGKVVMLEFMAPWCPHCQEDAPIFNQIHDAYKDKNLQMLAVNATGFGRNYENGDQSPITIDDQKWFHDNFKLAYPILFDKDVTAGGQYGISHFPTVYILDPTGVVVATPPNPIAFAELQTALDSALRGKAAAETTER